MPKKNISLDGAGWDMGPVKPGRSIEDVETWYPARVPGNVRTDLLSCGAIEDPFYSRRNEASKWVEKRDWWYRREFRLDPEQDLRTFLVFRGVDYECEIFVNGCKAAEHTGMFSPVILDITRRVARDNILAVRLKNTASLSDRISTLKCQMGFGWDFAPAIRTMGIWDSVSLVQCRELFIRRLGVDPAWHGGTYWEAFILTDIDAADAGEAEVEYTLTPDNFKSDFKIQERELELLRPGLNQLRTTIPAPDPKLWQPWEEGGQNMYRVNVTVRRNGKIMHRASTRFGFRHVELIPNEERPDHDWTFVINGKRKFIRGANWVPADSFPGRVDRARYEALLTRAREAGVNMLRVWGGGLREKKDFYDLCDDMGIMLWQEFPLSCPHARAYPRTARFRNLARKEARAIVHDCKNHASVVMFCGGNELSQSWNRRLLNDLHRIVKLHGGGRPFKPASPTTGERHNWIVHHSCGNIDEYLREEGSFLSEFGMQAPPVVASLRRFIPEENLWPVKPVFPYVLGEYSLARSEHLSTLDRFMPDSPEQRNARIWTYHDAQLKKIFRYAEQLDCGDLEEFVNASQRFQAHGLQVAIEHIRRRRFTASGVMFWQFNEPWPSICWSVIDYYMEPKLAYHTIKNIYNPLLVSLEFPLRAYAPGDEFQARVWVINDRHRAVNNLDIEIAHSADGETAARTEYRVPHVAPDSIAELEPLAMQLGGRDTRALDITLRQGGKVVGRNAYDLTLHDAVQTPAAAKLGFRLMEKVFWS